MQSLKTLDELREKANANQGGGKNFLNLKDGDQYRIRFLQELVEDGDNFDKERGTAAIVPVHTSPLNFRNKMACSEDPCWACEQVVKDDEHGKKWNARPRVLINVAVKEDENWTVKIFDQTFSKQHSVENLTEFASEYGSIVDREYKLKRVGAKAHDTNYTLTPLAEGPEPEGFENLELYDLSKVYPVVEYDAQEAWMTRVPENTEAKSW